MRIKFLIPFKQKNLFITKKYKTTLPVQVGKVYVVANRLSGKSIFVGLINPTEKGSKDISTTLYFYLLLDTETKQLLGEQSKTLPIIVHSGGHRLIQVKAMSRQ